MTDPSTAAPADPPSLASRFVGILFSPTETYRAVVAHPTWFGMVAVAAVVAAVGLYWFLSTEVGRQAAVDQAVSTMESFGRTVNDEAYAAIERQTRMARYINPVFALVMAPLMTAIVAGILLGVFNATLGGVATYRQVLAVVAHGAPVSVLQQLFSLPINYFRASASSPTNLSVFFPMLPEGGFLASFLGTIDLFLVWWVIVIAIGLAVLYRRQARRVATGLLAAYAVIGLAIAGVKLALGGQ